MRHFVFKARALEEEMALRANKGEEADFGAVDKARAEAGRWAKEVAEYRHAKISAVKLAGDPNAPVLPDNLTIDQLRRRWPPQQWRGRTLWYPTRQLSFQWLPQSVFLRAALSAGANQCQARGSSRCQSVSSCEHERALSLAMSDIV